MGGRARCGGYLCRPHAAQKLLYSRYRVSLVSTELGAAWVRSIRATLRHCKLQRIGDVGRRAANSLDGNAIDLRQANESARDKTSQSPSWHCALCDSLACVKLVYN